MNKISMLYYEKMTLQTKVDPWSRHKTMVIILLSCGDLWGLLFSPFLKTCLRNGKKEEYFFLFSLSMKQEFSWTKTHDSLLDSWFSISNEIVNVSCECDVSLCMAFTPVAPEFLVPLVDITCLLGDTVMLQCKVCGRPKPTITWKGPDQNMLDNDSSTAAITVTSWYVQSLRSGFCWNNEWIKVAIEYSNIFHIANYVIVIK